ncbi:MAG TPA: hypothetical protein PKD90_15005, partial [Phnomibacter sp.]|nr:hypothetical protein [Phnomibacter sp.]
PNTEFAYTIQKKPELPIVVKPMPNEGKVYFEMNEVPGLDYEPFMDAPRNYIQRVTFQLSKYINYFGGHKVSTNWEELATDMLRHSAFGGELGKKMDAPGLDALVAAATTIAEKATVIYNWVTKNVKCNCNFYGLYSDGGVKKALSNRLAMPTELNLILVNLLNQYGIEAYPMLAAERQFGKVNPDYPFKDRFNKAVAYAKVEANAPGWVMDASQPYMPAHVTPYNLLNTLGFIVRRKDPALIKIVRPQERFKQQYAIAATLNQAGNLEGKATIASSGYARYLSEQQQKELARNPLAFALEKNHAQLNVTHKEEEKLDSASQAMVRQITFNYNLGEEGQTLYIPTNLLLNLDKNPFNTTRRFSDVNFGYPVLIDYEQTITLPTGVKVKELPPIKVAATPDGQCRFTRSAETRPDGSIRIELMLVQNTTLVPADKYEEIRSFYATVSNLLQEPVVLSAPANGGKP